MPAFRYRAASLSGTIQKGILTATHEKDLAAALAERGMELIAFQPEKNALPFAFNWEGSRAKLEKIILLCRQMEDLLGAGLPFLDAITPLTEAFPPGPFRDKLADLTRRMAQGTNVGDAFAHYPTDFNPVFLAVLKAGEASGDLATTFGLLARQIERQAALQEKRQKALRYPLFLACLALGVTTFMMLAVVPQVVSFLQTLGSTLPRATRLLIATSSFFAAVWLPFLGLLAGGGVLTGALRALHPPFVQKTDALLLRIPLLGSICRTLALARFTSSLTILLKSGLALPEALSAAQDTLGNRALAAQTESARTVLVTGAPFSVAMAGLYAPLDLYALRVAETSGALTRVLDRTALSLESRADRAMDHFLGLIEPTLTLMVGALLAWVVLAVLGPIYGNLGVLGGGAP